jgi:hypothetical protein
VTPLRASNGGDPSTDPPGDGSFIPPVETQEPPEDDDFEDDDE